MEKGYKKLNNLLEFEIKAATKEEAIEIAKKDNNLDDSFEINVEELLKAKSFLGLINTKGTFKVSAKKILSNNVKEQIDKLIELMDIDLECEVEKGKNNNYSVNLKGPDNGIIIGKKGKTLNSFEYLINTLVKDAKI